MVLRMTSDIYPNFLKVTNKFRSEQKKQHPFVIWFTGLSGSGKSSLAKELDQVLCSWNKHTYVLDGDNVRNGLNSDLGFSSVDRAENIRRLGEVSRLFVDAGIIIIVACISPLEKERELVKSLFDENEFFEIYINTPLDECEKRDPKGIYKKVRAGKIRNFTGVDSIYEAPINPNLVIDTINASIGKSVEYIIKKLIDKKYI